MHIFALYAAKTGSITDNNNTTRSIHGKRPATRQNIGSHTDRIGGAFWLGGTGQAHHHQLLYEQPEHQIQLDLFAQNALGEEESGGFVRSDVAGEKVG
jgi:hypothetical protein